MIETQKYVRNPLYVDAVRVTNANFDEFASWCQGEILQDDVPGKGSSKRYIKVRVHNPKNPRQTKAFVGDWLLYTERGYKVYTNKGFNAAFALAEGFADLVEQERLKEAITTASSGVIENAELKSVSVVAEEPDPTGTGVQPIFETGDGMAGYSTAPDEYPETHTVGGIPREEINVGVVEETTTQGEPIEVVSATPENIAQAVDENEARRAAEEAGKRVLSVKEQGEMDQEEIRELLKTGEVILAQDLVS